MSNCTHRGLKLLLLSAALILSIALLATACSDGGDGDAADGADNTDSVSFDISTGDTFEPEVTNFFELNEFTVSAGQQVTFNVTNDGQSIHNMRIDGGDGEYDTDDDTISDPELFLPGDTGTLVWTAPDEAGETIFRCDFHPLDMVGTISVE